MIDTRPRWFGLAHAVPLVCQSEHRRHAKRQKIDAKENYAQASLGAGGGRLWRQVIRVVTSKTRRLIRQRCRNRSLALW
jgi:hypothetical protein